MEGFDVSLILRLSVVCAIVFNSHITVGANDQQTSSLLQTASCSCSSLQDRLQEMSSELQDLTQWKAAVETQGNANLKTATTELASRVDKLERNMTSAQNSLLDLKNALGLLETYSGDEHAASPYALNGLDKELSGIPQCSLTAKETKVMDSLATDLGSVRKSVNALEAGLSAMNTLLNVIKDKVLSFPDVTKTSEGQSGLTSEWERLVDRMEANLTALVTNQMNATHSKQEANKKRLEDVSADAVDFRQRLEELEARMAGEKNQTEALTAVTEQFKQRMDELEAGRAALEDEVGTLKRQLAARRCESGSKFFRPRDQPSVTVSGGGIVRKHVQNISFAAPFPSPPVVTIGFTSLDAAHNKNLRAATGLSDVTTSGFTLQVYEWADSTNYGVTVTWMACYV